MSVRDAIKGLDEAGDNSDSRVYGNEVHDLLHSCNSVVLFVIDLPDFLGMVDDALLVMWTTTTVDTSTQRGEDSLL